MSGRCRWPQCLSRGGGVGFKISRWPASNRAAALKYHGRCPRSAARPTHTPPRQGRAPNMKARRGFWNQARRIPGHLQFKARRHGDRARGPRRNLLVAPCRRKLQRKSDPGRPPCSARWPRPLFRPDFAGFEVCQPGAPLLAATVTSATRYREKIVARLPRAIDSTKEPMKSMVGLSCAVPPSQLLEGAR